MEGQRDAGSADCFALNGTLLSLWSQPPATSSVAEGIRACECWSRRWRNNWLAAEVSMSTDLWGAELSKRHSQMVSSNVPIVIDVFIR